MDKKTYEAPKALSDEELNYVSGGVPKLKITTLNEPLGIKISNTDPRCPKLIDGLRCNGELNKFMADSLRRVDLYNCPKCGSVYVRSWDSDSFEEAA